MTRRSWIIFASIAAAILIAGAAWWLWPRPGPPAAAGETAAVSRVPTIAEKRMLQEEAGEACRCARRLPPGNAARESCWAGFQRSIARYSHTVEGSMCMPLSPTLVCFHDGGECVVQDFDGGACNPEEARILEAIFADEQDHPAPGRDRMAEAVQAFIRGERVPRPRHMGEGCSG